MTAHCPTVRREGSGQGLTEFALVLPVLLLLILGVADLGRAVYAYNTIANAARTGARVAIVDQNLGSDCVANPGVAKCAAANQAVALGILSTSVTVTFRAYDLSAACSPIAIGCVAEVTVPYTYTAVTPVISALVGSITMSSTSRVPVERAFVSP